VAYSAGSLFAGSPRGDSVWLFSLKGTMEQTTPAPAISSDPASAPAPRADLANGQKIFGEVCAVCHGSSGGGGNGGPSLTSPRELEQIVQVVEQGGPQMPALGTSLKAKDIQDVSAYVREKIVH
jgi:quinohemoprotein ethanol dehydrogenase